MPLPALGSSVLSLMSPSKTDLPSPSKPSYPVHASNCFVPISSCLSEEALRACGAAVEAPGNAESLVPTTLTLQGGGCSLDALHTSTPSHAASQSRCQPSLAASHAFLMQTCVLTHTRLHIQCHRFVVSVWALDTGLLH